jgi:hypothetical protein
MWPSSNPYAAQVSYQAVQDSGKTAQGHTDKRGETLNPSTKPTFLSGYTLESAGDLEKIQFPESYPILIKSEPLGVGFHITIFLKYYRCF